ncbi:hypothetical protein ABB37_00284 [Leptomonas pyrrhocoris]|uniref:Uncharacterized protein n=1 Tax=Leptomonas pyrrhocoris TaxID=157538 RepID=A0A0N0E039_LEPPY|nr:hypothetical protein ABB37_00284 [Leptomonas pyrrhocoris]KPA85995.1 hypothetical protein ABB37_00284 [Leptomonas pyrrhocoris]|eukprot:XP_015664434.1 hypothetical protein ABB37_00284 [Leptomonas pyrrhocoris]
MSCAPLRHSAQARRARELLAACTRRVLFLLVCLLLFSLAWDRYSADGTHGLVAAPRWSGFIQSALAAEESADLPEVEVATPVSDEALQDAHPEAPLDRRADFHDEAAAEEAVVAGKVADPVHATRDFDGVSDDELKALLSDKKKGQVNFKHYKDRADLIKAIREVEEKEIAQKAFRDEVAAAARWFAETQEDLNYQRAAARRTKGSRIKHNGEVPASLRRGHHTDAPAHKLRVLYSAARGHGERFTALVKDLESSEAVKLPNLDAFRIVGEPYPISNESVLLGQVFQVLFYGVMALAIMPDLLPFIPEAVRNILRTRRGLVISTAFMLNMLSRSLLQNNAFEVYLDDELIYSTLKFGGRLPTSEMVSNMLLERTLLKDYAAAMSGQAAKGAAALL